MYEYVRIRECVLYELYGKYKNVLRRKCDLFIYLFLLIFLCNLRNYIYFDYYDCEYIQIIITKVLICIILIYYKHDYLANISIL